MHNRLFIVDGLRTPFSKFGTDLADELPQHLGVSIATSLLTKTGVDPSMVDHVVFGCCIQPANTIGNISRFISVRAGVPEEVPAVTVHRNCASGFEAVTYAYDKAQAGKGDVFLVGGVESMSRAPFLFPHDTVKKLTALARSKTLFQKLSNLVKFRVSDFSPEVSLRLGLIDGLCDMNMGETAELLAREYNITRKQQDAFSENSHLKALAARACGRFDNEVVPYHATNDDCLRSFNGRVIKEDNGPRNDAFVDKLAKLRPVFDKKQGTVTAGNASQVTDGGAAILLMTKKGLKKTGAVPMAELVDYTYVGCDPRRMGLGPVEAIKKLTCRTGTPGRFKLENMDIVEINEAFAAQVLACQKHLSVPREKLNVNGGAIALGHPLAATGARLVLTVAKELKHRDVKNGVASLCVGGGQGGALWIQNC